MESENGLSAVNRDKLKFFVLHSSNCKNEQCIYSMLFFDFVVWHSWLISQSISLSTEELSSWATDLFSGVQILTLNGGSRVALLADQRFDCCRSRRRKQRWRSCCPRQWCSGKSSLEPLQSCPGQGKFSCCFKKEWFMNNKDLKLLNIFPHRNHFI